MANSMEDFMVLHTASRIKGQDLWGRVDIIWGPGPEALGITNTNYTEEKKGGGGGRGGGVGMVGKRKGESIIIQRIKLRLGK